MINIRNKELERLFSIHGYNLPKKAINEKNIRDEWKLKLLTAEKEVPKNLIKHCKDAINDKYRNILKDFFENYK